MSGIDVDKPTCLHDCPWSLVPLLGQEGQDGIFFEFLVLSREVGL